jgi:hypothetical protein
MIPFFNGAQVREAVSPERALEAVREAFIAYARGEWTMPPKVYVPAYPEGDFRAMPALGGGHALLKWVTSFPGNPAQGLPTVTGLVLLSDATNGMPKAVLDVPDVELDSLVPGQLRPAVNLRPARDPGPDFETPALTRRVALDLVCKRGAGADEAHVAAHDVPQLRQLVDRQPAQQPAGARDAWIALVDGEPRTLPLCADLHRPQLHELELFAVQADAPLPVEDGAAVVELDRQRSRRKDGTCHHQSNPGGRGIERAVHRVPSALAQTAGTPKRR